MKTKSQAKNHNKKQLVKSDINSQNGIIDKSKDKDAIL